MSIYKELATFWVEEKGSKLSEQEMIDTLRSIDVNGQWNHRRGDVEFYKDTNYYLFDLTNYEASPAKSAYYTEMRRFYKANKCETLLDYGSGIGSDIIGMLDCNPKQIIAIDVPGPHSEYMLWRFKKRGILDRVKFITIADDGMPQGPAPECDFGICIAVLEHVPDPRAALRYLINSCKAFALKVDPTKDGNPMHFEKNFQWLHKVDGLHQDVLREYGIGRVNETDPVIIGRAKW